MSSPPSPANMLPASTVVVVGGELGEEGAVVAEHHVVAVTGEDVVVAVAAHDDVVPVTQRDQVVAALAGEHALGEHRGAVGGELGEDDGRPKVPDRAVVAEHHAVAVTGE